jgi:hypothetical protein
MMAGFMDNRTVRATFEEASAVLELDVWRLAQEGPEGDQNLTVNTQPLMLTAGVAVYRAWIEAGGARPFLLAGHSLGEYSAWVAAGAIEFRDALPLVILRAQAMQEAVPVGTGAMAAVLGLTGDMVHAATDSRVDVRCGPRRYAAQHHRAGARSDRRAGRNPRRGGRASSRGGAAPQWGRRGHGSHQLRHRERHRDR